MKKFNVKPNPEDPSLTSSLEGIDHNGDALSIPVVEEKPLTIFLNSQEIVTVMTIRDRPKQLALGYLINQGMISEDDVISSIDYDSEVETAIVRTTNPTDHEDLLRRKTLTSGGAQGTMFGDLMEKFDDIILDSNAIIKTSWIYSLSKQINLQPSLYLKAGAIHGCVLCEADRPLVYMEDVGRHNAIDKIAGYMHCEKLLPEGKLFYTTGRLTSEMIIKTVQMGIPILISRSGFSAWGVELARKAGLTVIGRARGARFIALSGTERIVFDKDAKSIVEEERHHQRKGSVDGK
jgi:FdhD protein